MDKKFEKDSELFRIVEYIFLHADEKELDIILDAAGKKKQEGKNFNLDKIFSQEQSNSSASYIPPDSVDAQTESNIKDIESSEQHSSDIPSVGRHTPKNDAQGFEDDPDVQLTQNEFAKKVLRDMKSGKMSGQTGSVSGKMKADFDAASAERSQEKFLPPLPEDHVKHIVREFTENPSTSNSALMLFCTAAFLEYKFSSMNSTMKAVLDKLLPSWPEKFWKYFPSVLQKDLMQTISSGGSVTEILQNIKRYCI